MNEPRNPSGIAREALKRLAQRRLAPTPANFQACYNEIAQLPDVAAFPEPPLRQIAAELRARNDAQQKALQEIDAAIARRSWLGVQEALLAFIAAAPAEAARGAGDAAPPAQLPPELALRLAGLLEAVLPALGIDSDRVLAMSAELVQALRQPVVDLPVLQGKLDDFGHQLGFVAEEQAEIKESLLKLLHLIVENVGELVLDDSWLKGQVDGLLAVLVPPLTLRRLDGMERRLRDVLEKQGEAKKRSLEAQEEMRQMLAAFIERLATMNASSASFQGKIEESARKIEKVRRVEDLAPLLKDVISASRAMAEDTSTSRQLLGSLQEKVLATEAELAKLHEELDNASALARHDPLTDVLNRKGLDESLAREMAGVRRKATSLSVCLLDLDNFKRINDRLGHDAGDRALVHLVDVARRSLRPTDTLARYGGEEFVILMPDTALDCAVEAMVRLQRELTRAIFMSGKDKVLITFSAGVAQLAAGESGSEAIKRADQAMYLAKRAGKNRVMAG